MRRAHRPAAVLLAACLLLSLAGCKKPAQPESSAAPETETVPAAETESAAPEPAAFSYGTDENKVYLSPFLGIGTRYGEAGLGKDSREPVERDSLPEEEAVKTIAGGGVITELSVTGRPEGGRAQICVYVYDRKTFTGGETDPEKWMPAVREAYLAAAREQAPGAVLMQNTETELAGKTYPSMELTGSPLGPDGTERYIFLTRGDCLAVVVLGRAGAVTTEDLIKTFFPAEGG